MVCTFLEAPHVDAPAPEGAPPFPSQICHQRPFLANSWQHLMCLPTIQGLPIRGGTWYVSANHRGLTNQGQHLGRGRLAACLRHPGILETNLVISSKSEVVLMASNLPIRHTYSVGSECIHIIFTHYTQEIIRIKGSRTNSK